MTVGWRIQQNMISTLDLVESGDSLYKLAWNDRNGSKFKDLLEKILQATWRIVKGTSEF